MSPAPVPLSPVDALFTVGGRADAQFCMAVRLRGPRPTRDQLVALVDERWGDADRLRLALRGPGRPRWHPVGHGTLERHVLLRHRDEDSEPAAVAAILDTPLPDGLPRWRLILLGDPDDTTWTLLLVVHHTLLDGLSTRALMARLLAPHATPDETPTTAPAAPAGMTATLWHTLRTVARRSTGHRRVTRRHLALAQVPLEAFRNRPATVNDVFLDTVAAVLGRSGPEARRCARAIVPVNVRTAPALGNHALALQIRLPWEISDPARRLAAIGRLTSPAVRAETVAKTARALRWAARVGRPALRLVEFVGMRGNAMTCSSMRPLPEGLALGPARVVGAYFTTVHPRGLAVGLTGAGEDMSVTVVADDAFSGFADRLAAGIAAELVGDQNLATSG